ncbi:MAG: formate--tetrahydrofolate ligase [Pseudobdellovibrionaceae bacterium]|nr:formate--tetrahydrofolate ligase [Pseudobdellovibrionaceae bacterium]
MSDLQIARSVTLKHIFEVAQTLGIHSEDLIPFGRYKAKVTANLEARLNARPIGRYVLVTAINPTPLGEGKTTTSIGLSMGLCRLGHRSVVTLRQPSLGEVAPEI